MKYFVSDDHWDMEGYWHQLRSLSNRFSKDTFQIISQHSFHDASILEFKISNTSLIRRTIDPTKISAILHDIDGFEYHVEWSGVNRIDFSFSGKKKLYRSIEADDYDLQLEDRKGLEEWAYDEITSVNEVYLNHEITLHSGALIHLVFKGCK